MQVLIFAFINVSSHTYFCSILYLLTRGFANIRLGDDLLDS